MSFQNRKPNVPASIEKSASHGSRRNCFAAALLLGIVLFPAISTAAESNPSYNRAMMRGDNQTYVDGVYFLVSQPFSQAKAELEKSFAEKPILKRFNARDDSAPLSKMEPYGTEPDWAGIAVSHRPDVQAALNQQIKEMTAATFTAALTTSGSS